MLTQDLDFSDVNYAPRLQRTIPDPTDRLVLCLRLPPGEWPIEAWGERWDVAERSCKDTETVRLLRKLPAFEEYSRLRVAVGWSAVPPARVAVAFAETKHVSAIRDNADELRAFARTVGDGELYLYVQDVMVDPVYQHQGLGSQVIEDLLQQVRDTTPSDAFIGVLAMPGTDGFYARLGFESQWPRHSVMQITLESRRPYE